MLALFSFLFALLCAVATAVTIGVSTDPAYKTFMIVPLALFCVSATFTAKPAIDYLRDC